MLLGGVTMFLVNTKGLQFESLSVLNEELLMPVALYGSETMI